MKKSETDTVIAALCHWWRQQQGDGPGPQTGAARAALARLRRAATPDDVLMLPDHHALRQPLIRRIGRGLSASEETGLAIASGALATVREEEQSRHTARLLGPPDANSDEGAAMSELRFRRLLHAGDAADRMRQLRRAVQLLGGRAHLPSLIAAALNWDDPAERRRWIFAYYDAPQFIAAELPDQSETVTEEAPS